MKRQEIKITFSEEDLFGFLKCLLSHGSEVDYLTKDSFLQISCEGNIAQIQKEIREWLNNPDRIETTDVLIKDFIKKKKA